MTVEVVRTYYVSPIDIGETMTPTRIQQAEHRDRAGGARILLYHDGEAYYAYRRDAEELDRVMGWEPSYQDESETVRDSSFYEERLPEILRRCVAAGFRVAVLDPVTVTA